MSPFILNHRYVPISDILLVLAVEGLYLKGCFLYAFVFSCYLFVIIDYRCLTVQGSLHYRSGGNEWSM